MSEGKGKGKSVPSASTSAATSDPVLIVIRTEHGVSPPQPTDENSMKFKLNKKTDQFDVFFTSVQNHFNNISVSQYSVNGSDWFGFTNNEEFPRETNILYVRGSPRADTTQEMEMLSSLKGFSEAVKMLVGVRQQHQTSTKTTS